MSAILTRRWKGLMAVAALASLAAGCASVTPDEATARGYTYGDRGGGAPRPEDPYRLLAAGDSPFWSATLTYFEDAGGPYAELQLRAPGAESVTAYLDYAPDYLQDGGRRYLGHGRRGETIEASFDAGECVDAAGHSRGYFATITFGGSVFVGCAREQGGDGSWTRDLHRYMPALEACLAEFPRGAEAVFAYQMGDGVFAVRVSSNDETRECAWSARDRRLTSMRPLDAADAHAQQGREAFLRTRTLPARTECRSWEAVRNADGDLIGAIGHDQCLAPRRHAMRERPTS